MFKNEETNIQVAFANYLRYTHPNVLFTISPSGMKLPPWIAKMLKAMGYRAGTPDMHILEPRGQWHGLYIELKTSKGTLSLLQKDFLIELDKRGYKTAVCYGYDVAVEFVNGYLKIK